MTRTGVGLLVASILSYAAGVLLGYGVLVALAIGGAAALVCAAAAVAVRPRVVLRRRVEPERVSVGESAMGRIEAHNQSRWPSPAFVAEDRVGAERVEVAVAALAGGGRRAAHYPVPTTRRGRLRMGPLTVVRRDPLGLLRRARAQASDEVLWVHPRVHPMRPLPIGLVLDYEGTVNENSRAGTVTFSSLREYVAGDDPRQIHWRSTARTGSMMVREHVDTTEPRTAVVLDTRAGVMDEAVFEHAVEVAASVAEAVAAVGRPVALHIVGEEIAASAHPRLDRLAAVAQTPDQDPARLLEVVDRVDPGGNLVVVTGTADPAAVTKLADQRRRFGAVVAVTLFGGHGHTGGRRRPGMVVLSAGTATDAAGAWNQMVGGGTR
ncbi:DUF58 domain-containing protein [Actinokineospora sp. NBRC 105648]|uniref:DUF58 domain-containing protein n=1 Tax=Actinokineospora sp. NBRC 105648 TaxID=3032206 RepID=UPI0024A51BA9|nr:DUF58 domain-containing protein [Actinokineospora sp. NBRC 105648]GLZ40609.1 hypothetical protein Acsp05_42330 [Actinokineospora sp. NBRC 105648]